MGDQTPISSAICCSDAFGRSMVALGQPLLSTAGKDVVVLEVCSGERGSSDAIGGAICHVDVLAILNRITFPLPSLSGQGRAIRKGPAWRQCLDMLSRPCVAACDNIMDSDQAVPVPPSRLRPRWCTISMAPGSPKPTKNTKQAMGKTNLLRFLCTTNFSCSARCSTGR